MKGGKQVQKWLIKNKEWECCSAVLTCTSCYSSPLWSRLHLHPKRPLLRKSVPPIQQSSTPRQRSQCTSAETARQRNIATLISKVCFLLHSSCVKQGQSVPTLAQVDLMHSSAGHNIIYSGIYHMKNCDLSSDCHAKLFFFLLLTVNISLKFCSYSAFFCLFVCFFGVPNTRWCPGIKEHSWQPGCSDWGGC